MSTGLNEVIERFHRRNPSKARPSPNELDPTRSHTIPTFPNSIISNSIPSSVEFPSVPLFIQPPPHNSTPPSTLHSKHLSYIPPSSTTTRSGRKSKPRNRDLETTPTSLRSVVERGG
ncbi:hypothetical protein FRC02_003387 [Tulasnella sp. 418]|nr:hypothetical protein FRC02_003387 [Tulasnella sp. 418]